MTSEGSLYTHTHTHTRLKVGSTLTENGESVAREPALFSLSKEKLFKQPRWVG